MKRFKILLLSSALSLIGGVLFVYLGVFNVAADDPHTRPMYWLMEMVRERSVAVRARGIEVPSLSDPAMIAAGGADYDEMCTGCHLQPGMDDSELSTGLYPKPPRLASVRRDNPAQTFWIIKHGFKMSGMPAWGLTHDDTRLWAMVAFLQQLPRLSAEQYAVLTAHGDGNGDMRDHEHAGGAMEGMSMPGMKPNVDSHHADEHRHAE